MRTRTRLLRVAGAILLVVAVAGALGLLGLERGGGSRQVAPSGVEAGSSHVPPAVMRTLVVSARREPAPSRPGATMRALRLTGVVPRTAVVGTVLSDDDCAPDAAGISHCINRVRLANGSLLSVRHPHRMAEVPCMTTGERVQVRAV